MPDRTIRPGLMPRLRARLELRMLGLAVLIAYHKAPVDLNREPCQS